MGGGNSKDKVAEELMKKKLAEFKQRQDDLERILNRGRPLIEKQPHLGHIKMPVAPSGKGKSTVCNVFEGTSFPTGASRMDVTKCMEAKVFPDKVVVDTVGMDVNYENIGKIFLLFFIHGIFPDYFIHVNDDPRLASIAGVTDLMNVGLIKMCLVEFRAADFYEAIELKKPFASAIARGAGFEVVPSMKVEKLEAKLASDPKNEEIKEELAEAEQKVIVAERRNAQKEASNAELERWIAHEDLASHFVYFNWQRDAEKKPPLPAPTGTMHTAFMAYFFDEAGRYKPAEYPEYIEGLERRNPFELLRGLMIMAVKVLKKHTPINEKTGETVTPPKDWEVNYLRDKVW
jgi:hypothetical protein